MIYLKKIKNERKRGLEGPGKKCRNDKLNTNQGVNKGDEKSAPKQRDRELLRDFLLLDKGKKERIERRRRRRGSNQRPRDIVPVCLGVVFNDLGRKMSVNYGRHQDGQARKQGEEEGLQQSLVNELQAEEVHRLVVKVDEVEKDLDVKLVEN